MGGKGGGRFHPPASDSHTWPHSNRTLLIDFQLQFHLELTGTTHLFFPAISNQLMHIYVYLCLFMSIYILYYINT